MPVDEREERVIATEADVLTGVKVRSALAYEDVSGAYILSIEALYATTLSV